MFSNKSLFYLDASQVNHNAHYWSHEDPHYYVSKPLQPPRVTVWCAFSSPSCDRIILFSGERNWRQLQRDASKVFCASLYEEKGILNSAIFQPRRARSPHVDWKSGMATKSHSRTLDFVQNWQDLATKITWPKSFALLLVGLHKSINWSLRIFQTIEIMKERIRQIVRRLNTKHEILG